MSHHSTFPHLPLDMDSATSAVYSFADACAVGCHLLSPKGEVVISSTHTKVMCTSCQGQCTKHAECEKTRVYGAYQAEHLGGRYIYLCPNGLAWCASPVMVGGRTVAHLTCGPVLIMALEDYCASHPMADEPGVTAEDLAKAVMDVPYKTPLAFGSISAQLLALAVYIGDHSRLLVQARQYTEQQQSIGETIQSLKSLKEIYSYPMDKERELVRSILDGDQKTARYLLNELLGHIFFYTGGDFPMMRSRSVELMAIISRAAINGGADLRQVMALSHHFLYESIQLQSVDDLTDWLTRGMEQYTRLVFDMVDIKHKDIIYKAIEYIKRNYANHLTLDEVAQYIGFSPTYFSKVFKDALGETFTAYLTQLRIEKSTALLLDPTLSISHICMLSGFDDQSYFIKVFRKHLGVTPGQYRKRQARLDVTKERTSD